MNRSLLRRIQRYIRSQFIDFLDLAPEQDSSRLGHKDPLDEFRERMGAAIAERHAAEKELAALLNGNAAGQSAAPVEQAIEMGRDDLAKAVIRERHKIKARQEELEKNLAVLAREIDDIERALSAFRHSTSAAHSAKKIAELEALIANIRKSQSDELNRNEA